MFQSTFTGLQQYGFIFIGLTVVAAQICEISRNSPKIRTYSTAVQGRSA